MDEYFRFDDLVPSIPADVIDRNPDLDAEEARLSMELDHTPTLYYNEAKDNKRLQKEKPEHRIMLHLKLAGKTNHEIAKITNYTYVAVCQICRQEWFLQAFTQLAQLNGRDAVQSLFEAEGLNSVQTLLEIRDTAKSESVRRQAATDILDRWLGKPLQKVESKNTNTNIPANVAQDILDLDAKIEENRQLLGLKN